MRKHWAGWCISTRWMSSSALSTLCRSRHVERQSAALLLCSGGVSTAIGRSWTGAPAERVSRLRVRCRRGIPGVLGPRRRLGEQLCACTGGYSAKQGGLWPAALECIAIRCLENYLVSLCCITVVRNTGQTRKEKIDICVYSSWNILISPVWHFFGISFKSRLSFLTTLEINVLLPLT